MKVNSKQLREFLNRMLDYAEHELGDYIELDFSTFWTITFRRGQSLDEPEPTLADFRDDVKDLLDTYNDKTGLLLLDYEKMGNIIKAIGYQIFEKK